MYALRVIVLQLQDPTDLPTVIASECSVSYGKVSFYIDDIRSVFLTFNIVFNGNDVESAGCSNR